MKKILLISLLLFSYVMADAQTQGIRIRLANGTEVTYPIDNIESMDFETLTLTPHEDYQYVDLGLSVKWATCNVGASSPEEYGDLFSWGEVSPKKDYAEESYTYYVNSGYQSIGTSICGTEYDAATKVWGSDWRMPTRLEIMELMNKCTWSADTIATVSGYRITGPSGESIFLPSAGYASGTERKKAGTQGYYWSGTLDSSMPSSAYNINFKGYNTPWSASRAYGFSVRAVKQ